MTVEDDPLAALEAAKARLQVRLDSARAAADDASRLSSDIRSLVRTVTSPLREVSVMARANGEVTRIDVGETAFELTAQELSALLTHTVAAAQRAAAGAAVDDIAAEVGEASPLVTALRRDVSNRTRDEGN